MVLGRHSIPDPSSGPGQDAAALTNRDSVLARQDVFDFLDDDRLTINPVDEGKHGAYLREDLNPP